jgi:phosphoribosylformimino-5-aminoimidazole carboxamide ribotide isomerase
MEIIPAIDIRGGRCVRLEQGDYARETIFADDPATVARRWQSAGARRIHVVDLDGAREGQVLNRDAVLAVVSAVSIPVQLGGGIRDLATVERYLAAGVDRVILGTAAVKDQMALTSAVAHFRERIAVGVDARDGFVAIEGWRETSSVAAVDLVRQISEAGVSRVIYTDILRDGVLKGPNFAAMEEMVAQASGLPLPVAVIASGGVSSIDHLKRLATTGVEGAIVGRALYTGDVDLVEALAALSP